MRKACFDHVSMSRNVLGGVGMQASNVSLCFPTLTRFLTRWIRTTLPEDDFPFSSLQVNYNYAAKRHVDGNNIGPSYIKSLGAHRGGELWVADKYVEGIDSESGSKFLRGGGGAGTLDCKNQWRLFNGNVEHETCPVMPLGNGQDKKKTRISFIVFSHSAYNRLPAFVVEDLQSLGFTAASSDGTPRAQSSGRAAIALPRATGRRMHDAAEQWSP